MVSISDVATQMYACKIMAIALPKFYKKTKLNAQFSFSYNPADSGIQITLGFSPREANEQEYNCLFEELIDAEKLLINDYIIHNGSNFENIKQLIFKHKEDTLQILNKNK